MATTAANIAAYNAEYDPDARAGHSVIPQSIAREHTLIVQVLDRVGAVDRVVGLMRRRRANMQTLTLSGSESDNVVRVTVTVNDAEVAVGHLVEQLRKILEVREVISIPEQQALIRELAMIKVGYSPEKKAEVFGIAELFGAHVAEVAAETATFEVSGSPARVAQCIEQLRVYDIREIARSGRVTMARGTED
ncbi:acetolactate synthase small subunit [Ktedonospora formicarum]|uniref:Acetolactate synthase small subunit n=1 Tax=Ktedonospora formicarum TaxID=2778364 RepID=A0A8J3I0M5_9CHLR|nr:acetolactate synthase small subunit [Ktedonospora formicarum]GHO45421.1 acetolactate synthase small subunit [Ktedonospora formicarum]